MSYQGSRPSLLRETAAEFVGTALLVVAVVGSGIAASRLSPQDVGLQLLENAVATGLALAVLVLIFMPVSGAHFNPVVTAAVWWLARGDRAGLSVRKGLAFVVAQVAGAVAGAVLADVMYGLDPVSWSQTTRSGADLWLAEVVATAGLILLIFALVRSDRVGLVPMVGAYIAAAYWFTSSTSFANPAVTVGRAFTDTFAGIAPASVPAFVVAQMIGGAIGVAAAVAFYPRRQAGVMSEALEPSAGPRD